MNLFVKVGENSDCGQFRQGTSGYCRMWQEYVFTTSQICFPASNPRE